jgi:hypothetical protein
VGRRKSAAPLNFSLDDMRIIVLNPRWHEPCHLARELLLTSRDDYFKLEAYRLKAWVEVTHETKNAVMARISEDDLVTVGCKNPDIYVNGKKDDRIVLTRPRTYRNEKGKSKKHITDVKASEIFGDEWPDHLNILKLQTLGYFHEEMRERHEHMRQLLEDENAMVVFVMVSPSTLLAYICH